jgi:hypothetical protein
MDAHGIGVRLPGCPLLISAVRPAANSMTRAQAEALARDVARALTQARENRGSVSDHCPERSEH